MAHLTFDSLSDLWHRERSPEFLYSERSCHGIRSFHDQIDNLQENVTDFQRLWVCSCDLGWRSPYLACSERLSTEYQCATFHTCSDDRVYGKDANVWIFRGFLSALTTVTSVEGHTGNWYNLKSIAAKYLHTNFHDSLLMMSDKVEVVGFFQFFHRPL